MSEEKSKKHYVDNKSFYAALIKYKIKRKKQKVAVFLHPRFLKILASVSFKLLLD